jgi:hypothetical protein
MAFRDSRFQRIHVNVVIAFVFMSATLALPAGPASAAPNGGAVFVCNANNKVFLNGHDCPLACGPGAGHNGLAAIGRPCSAKEEAACPRLKPLMSDVSDIVYGSTPLGVISPVLKSASEKRLAEGIIRNYFAAPQSGHLQGTLGGLTPGISGHTWGDVNIPVIMVPPNPHYWAHYNRVQGRMEVTSDLFKRSVAKIVATVGHEMIHAGQQARPPLTSSLLDTPTSYFLEFEGLAWELASPNYTWDFAPNPSAKCLLTDERAEVRDALKCVAWQIPAGLHKVLVAQPGVVGAMQTWLQGNWWTAKYWLPKHQNWMTQYGKSFQPLPSPRIQGINCTLSTNM